MCTDRELRQKLQDYIAVSAEYSRIEKLKKQLSAEIVAEIDSRNKTADPETREKAKQYNLDKHTENIISGRHDLIMFTAGKLIAIFKAEHDLATQHYQEGKTDYD